MQHIYHRHQGAFVQSSAPNCQVDLALFEPCLSDELARINDLLERRAGEQRAVEAAEKAKQR